MYMTTKPLDERMEESRTMRTKYPDRLPIIVEPKDAHTPSIDKRKYMVQPDLTFGHLMYVVRRRLMLRSDQALFFFTSSNQLQPASSTIGSIFDRVHDEDGFLYIVYAFENTFG